MIAETRNIEQSVLKDLQSKFVFLSGPRQVGKTTLAKRIIAENQGTYLLFDDPDDRRIMINRKYTHERWVCLDEFHKFSRWKNHIKGVYDKYHETLHLILTGSARLDVYQKSGDSLFGRYYLHHLHPLTAGELASAEIPPLPTNEMLQGTTQAINLKSLLSLGGFPEPFYKQSETEHRRWQNMRRQLLVREELRDLAHLQLLDLAEQLMLLIPSRIGSLTSVNALAEDIQTSPPTIQNWLSLFERLYFIFRITPYANKISRSLKKQPKHYLYDWSEIQDEGARFENFVASHLWKAVQIWTDSGLANLSLHFVRDRDNREVDFLVAKDKQPWFLVECKLSDTQLSENLRYFSQRLNVPGLQLVLKENVAKTTGRCSIISANQWLGLLP